MLTAPIRTEHSGTTTSRVQLPVTVTTSCSVHVWDVRRSRRGVITTAVRRRQSRKNLSNHESRRTKASSPFVPEWRLLKVAVPARRSSTAEAPVKQGSHVRHHASWHRTQWIPASAGRTTLAGIAAEWMPFRPDDLLIYVSFRPTVRLNERDAVLPPHFPQVASVHVDSMPAFTRSFTAAAATPSTSCNRPCRTPA